MGHSLDSSRPIMAPSLVRRPSIPSPLLLFPPLCASPNRQQQHHLQHNHLPQFPLPPNQPPALHHQHQHPQQSSEPDTDTDTDLDPAPQQLSSNRASMRYSTYTTPAPSMHSFTSDTVQAEIADITAGLAKLDNKKLASQRFVPSQEKTENLSKLALGAKLERALDRRMKGQDAVMRKKVVKREQQSEKDAIMA